MLPRNNDGIKEEIQNFMRKSSSEIFIKKVES